MENKELVIVLDFGSQYNELIARRIRDNNVYCEVLPYTTELSKIKNLNPKGIILIGNPNSDYNNTSINIVNEIFKLNIPILGISYGANLISCALNGNIKKCQTSKYEKVEVDIISKESKLFKNISKKIIAWMPNFDYIEKLPAGFIKIADTKKFSYVAIENEDKKIYALQFDPEVDDTQDGKQILKNFLYEICECKGLWKISSFVELKIEELKNKIGNKKVLLALSGGVDSTVCAVLLSKAVGKNLTCIFVDHGLMRKNEGDEIEKVFTEKYNLNFIRVNAQQRFYNKLKGVTEPERKRKIIGEEFIRVFEEESKKIGKIDFFAQGTIYPDVIESGLGKTSVIKSHHNVGGLPDYVDFKEIIEPLRMLFKDEVRKVGLELKIPENLIFRQPFPGPGLGVRIVGEITEEKVKIIQNADYIFREEIKNAGYDKKANQYFAALSNMKSVGIIDNNRTYDYAVILRAVNTIDFMTAEITELPYEILLKCVSRIINEVKGVNRVMYDLTSKPPGTIELE